MAPILKQFKSESQDNSGRLELLCAEVDLTALARSVVFDSRAAYPPYRLRFEGDGACLIWGDYTRLKRMLQILIASTVNYIAPRLEINTSVWRRAADVWLTVENQRHPVSPSDANRILNPFHRHDVTGKLPDGKGTGLSAVQKIVQSHSGEMLIRGEPGRGTTIEIRFKARLRA